MCVQMAAAWELPLSAEQREQLDSVIRLRLDMIDRQEEGDGTKP